MLTIQLARFRLPLTVDNTSIEDDALDSSDDEPSDVEILSPPRKRPVTHSVSAKRVADEQEDPLSSPIPLPPAKKVRREATRNSMFSKSPYLMCYVY